MSMSPEAACDDLDNATGTVRSWKTRLALGFFLRMPYYCISFAFFSGQKAKDKPKKEKKTKKAEKEVPPTEVDEGERFRNKTCFALSFPTGPQKVLSFSQSIGRRICGRDP